MPTAAQEFRGRIIGTVSDNTGAVLPGVTVNATSPALIQPQNTVTEADGTYMMQALPAGVYELTFELAGFETTKREAIRVVINTTLTVNATMQIGGVQETVVVTGASPVVDTSSTRVGTNFTKELLTEIPNARDIWAAMAQAPGMTVTGYDVGGSRTGTQTGYLTVPVQRPELDAARRGEHDRGELGQRRVLRLRIRLRSCEIGGSGNMADQDSPGAQLNLITKSGGDNFSGTFYQDYEDENTISNNIPDALKVAGGSVPGGYFVRSPLTRGNPIKRQSDTNMMLGGRIVRGKVWFYTSARWQPAYKYILGMSETLYSWLSNGTGKITYQLNQNNQIIAFYNRRVKSQDKRNYGVNVPLSASGLQDSRYALMKAEWLGTLSSRALLDVLFGQWLNSFPIRPQKAWSTIPGQANSFFPGRQDTTSGLYLDGGPYNSYQKQYRRKPQLYVTLNYSQPGWHGTHDFKFGTEIRNEESEPFQDQPYNMFYNDQNGLFNVNEVVLYNTPSDPVTKIHMRSVYGQDSWRFNSHLTINMGLRMDHYTDGWAEGQIAPEGPILVDTAGRPLAGADPAGVMAAVSVTNPTFYQTRTIPAGTVAKTTDYGPRIGFAYDFKGDGKTSMKGYWGRFYYNSSGAIADISIPYGESEMYYKFTDLNGNKVLDGPQELGSFVRTTGGAGSVSIDPKLKRSFGDELSFHFEHEIMQGLSGRLSFVKKTAGDTWATVDLARINAFTIPVTVTVPAQAAENLAASTITVYDIPRGTPENRVFTNTLMDKPVYKTIEVAINRRFRDKWMAMASFGNTWFDDTMGNTSTTSSTGVAGNGSQAWVWQPNQRRWGQEKTHQYNAKIVGQYVMPYELGVSVSYKLQQGRNYGRSLAITTPNFGAETIRVEPVTTRRAPTTGILDVRLDKKFNLYKTARLAVMVDIFNILNANPVMTFRSTAGTRFKEISALLDPRIFRVGIAVRLLGDRVPGVRSSANTPLRFVRSGVFCFR